MSESMVERVAKAIKSCTDAFGAPVKFYIKGEAQRRWEIQNPDGDWFDQPESRDELGDYKIIARAAIEAMRRPTDEMKRDGWQELRKHNDIQTRLGNSLVGVETPTYQAMIDAASQGR